MKNGPLTGVTVLDLSDEKGQFCGKILADLGADVIKVEQPGGDPARRIGPYYHDEMHPEKSLVWFAFNTGKRSVTLNLATADGRALFRRLAERADVVIESHSPGHMAELGLGYEELTQVNRGLIMVSITGFGQTGPYSDFKAPDLVVMAMGGEMNLMGNPEGPPLRIGVPQAYLHAGSEGALGALFALWHRGWEGEGQHVDVSAQECVTWIGFVNQLWWDIGGLNLSRLGGRFKFGSGTSRSRFPCRDGHVIFRLVGGVVGAGPQRRLVGWMDREGMADEFLKTFDWEAFDAARADTELSLEFEARFTRFFLTKTKAELLDAAVEEGLLIAPANNIADVLEDRQFKARGFWVELEHEALGARLIYPGAPYHSTGMPYRVSSRAPLIGEHNNEVYGQEMGLSVENIIALHGEGVI